MVREHYQFNAHEFEQALGDSGGQRSLAYCSQWGHKLEISSKKLEIPSEHFMQRWAQQRTEMVWS